MIAFFIGFTVTIFIVGLVMTIWDEKDNDKWRKWFKDFHERYPDDEPPKW